jgi:hypothetical protein
VTYERVLQSGIEDRGYARRIALLRSYYFDQAPELTAYLLSVPETSRLEVQGLWGGRWQRYRTVAGMVATITAVLAGSAMGLLSAIISDHSLAAALVAGGLAAAAALVTSMHHQAAAWRRAALTPITADHQARATAQSASTTLKSHS